MHTMGSALRKIRVDQGQSQETIALSAGGGIAVDTYRALELGERGGSVSYPKLDTLLRVFDALGIEPPILDAVAPYWRNADDI